MKRKRPAPARERGEYRPIPSVLLDGPDFQSLHAEARWVFVACKIKCGPCGIAVISGLESAISEWTGLDVPAVSRALAHLEHGETPWIQRERNVIWILGGLQHEPSRNVNDQKHRASVVVLLAGMPRLEIVRAFVNAHRNWCSENSILDKRLAWVDEESTRTPPGPSEGSAQSLRSTDYGLRNTDNGIRSSVSGAKRPNPRALSDRAPAASGSVYDYLHRAWSIQAGAVDVGRFRKRIKELITTGVRVGQIERAIGKYVAAMRERGKDIKLEWFAENIQTWIREADGIAAEVMDPADLGLTPEEASEKIAAHRAALEEIDSELLRRLTLEVVA